MKNVVTRLVNSADASRTEPASATNGPMAAATGYLNQYAEARLCNEAVQGLSSPLDQALLIGAAAKKLEELFDVLRIDHTNDHNTRETPQRVAKMLVRETLRGRFMAPPEITDFENAQGFDNLIVTGPIDLRSTCAHHMMPIYGEGFVGIVPARDGKIIGLSK
jgi:GTP cyclohydrolase I